MSDQIQKPLNDTSMRQRAFSRWENEGGAPTSGREIHPVNDEPLKTPQKEKNMRIVDSIENENPGLADN